MAGLETFISGMMGIGGGWLQNQQNQELNRQSFQQQQQLLELQQQFANQQAGLADARARAMYNDLQSPEALRNQIEKAGLSVGLMYGQGGMQGSLQAGAQAESPSAPSRNMLAMENIVGAQTQNVIANAEKLEAEKRNIDMDTNVKEGEAAKNWKDIPIKEKQLIIMENTIERTKTEIAKLNEEIKTEVEKQINLAKDSQKKEEEAKLVEAQTSWTQTQEFIANKLADAQEQEILAHAREMNAAANKMNIEASTMRATMQATIKQAYYEAALKEIELIYAPHKKDLEWSKMQSELEKTLEEAYEHGVSNEMYRSIEKKFGKTAASILKNGTEMISVVLKGAASTVTKVVK